MVKFYKLAVHYDSKNDLYKCYNYLLQYCSLKVNKTNITEMNDIYIFTVILTNNRWSTAVYRKVIKFIIRMRKVKPFSFMYTKVPNLDVIY